MGFGILQEDARHKIQDWGKSNGLLSLVVPNIFRMFRNGNDIKLPLAGREANFSSIGATDLIAQGFNPGI
jgi:hypothetical protein